MRRAFAVAVVVATGLVIAAPAAAKAPTLKSLQAQVTALNKKVKKLQTQESQNRVIASAALVYSGCAVATLADALQNTWKAIDAYVTGKGDAAVFGAQTPTNDYGVCQALQITRATSQSPPNVSVLQVLLEFFK
jgi:hypothetical protein